MAIALAADSFAVQLMGKVRRQYRNPFGQCKSCEYKTRRTPFLGRGTRSGELPGIVTTQGPLLKECSAAQKVRRRVLQLRNTCALFGPAMTKAEHFTGGT